MTLAWTLDLISHLDEAPFPATKSELIDYAARSGCPQQIIEHLQELEEEDETLYDSLIDLWPDYPTGEDYLFNEEEY